MSAATAPARSAGRIALYRDPLPADQPQTYTAADVARLLGVGEQTVRDHVRRHGCIQVGERRIPAITIMSRVRFPKAAVHAALSA